VQKGIRERQGGPKSGVEIYYMGTDRAIPKHPLQTQNTISHIVQVINTCEQRTLQKEIFTQWKLLRSNTGASWCPHVETLAWFAATPEAFSDNNLLIIWDFNEDLNDMVCLEPFFELDTIL
jgi:hypothetical protein